MNHVCVRIEAYMAQICNCFVCMRGHTIALDGGGAGGGHIYIEGVREGVGGRGHSREQERERERQRERQRERERERDRERVCVCERA